uniref:DUF7666 domain-containing protein n=1 Tax=viral metagenome TaxID=1070528 RepID=A0A6M3K1D2_9ZZZZ
MTPETLKCKDDDILMTSISTQASPRPWRAESNRMNQSKTQIRYKLTDADIRSNAGTFQWEVGKWYSVKGKIELCNNGFHCYQHPLLAVLHNPIHGNFGPGMRLWKIEVSGQSKTEGAMKECWQRARVIEEIPVPAMTTNQRIRYAILCAKHVCFEPQWTKWADNWLSGGDRSVAAAWAARAAEAAEENVDLATLAERAITEEKSE